MSNIRKLWNALLEFDSEWRKEDNMPLNILQNIFQEENEGLIGTLVAQIEIGTEHIFANNWIQEEFYVESNEVQMGLSGTESHALYLMVMNKIKIKWTINRITSINNNRFWKMISRQ